MTRISISVIALFVGIVYFQLFVTPNIGLANNGDYQKMIGRFSLGPMDVNNQDEQVYYEQRWRYDPSYYWVSDNYSSELIWIGAAVELAKLFNKKQFDMRVLGVIHALLWTGFFVIVVTSFRRLSGWSRYALPALVLFVFTDASYVTYLNSFHTDTSAFIFLCCSVAIAFRIAMGDWKGWWPYAALLITTLLFITAKPQHSLLGLLWWMVVLMLAPDWTGRALTVLIPAAVLLTIMHVPVRERQLELFNAIFAKLLPRSANPDADLRALGLPVDMKSWIGAYGDQPVNNPMQNPRVTALMTPRVHRGLARFYLTHPSQAFEVIYLDLGWPATQRRPPFFGNYERKVGVRPSTLARSFHWWSDLRSWLFRVAPWHIWIWYLTFAAGAGWFLRRTRRAAPVIALVLAAMGLVALASASLGEIGETDRHLWLFHVITDITIVILTAAFSSEYVPFRFAHPRK